MAISWGSWAGPSGTRFRVGIDLSVSGTKITAKYYVESEGGVSDNQTLTLTGSATGTVAFNNSTTGSRHVVTKTKTGSRGKSYSFTAKLSGVYNGASPSKTHSISIPVAVPSAPGKPTLSNVTDGGMTLAWAAPSTTNGGSITRYQAQRADNSAFTLNTASAFPTSRSYSSSALNANKTYYWRVRAENSAGWGPWSSTSSATTKPDKPLAPSNLTVTRVSDTNHTIKWSGSATGERPLSGFYVERRDNTNFMWNRVKSLAGMTSNTWSDTTTIANRRYDYRIKAYNSAGPSDASSSVGVSTRPAAPSNVSAVKSGANINVAWTRNATYAGVTNHVIQDNPGGTGWVTVATVGVVSSWTHSSVNASVTHQYRVLARNTSGTTLDSAYSATSAVVQLLAPPSAPTRLGPTGTFDATKPVNVSWRHNPVDTTAQSAYEMQYQLQGAGAWTTVTGTTAQQASIPALDSTGIVEWRVRTKGEHATYGPYSSVGTFSVEAPGQGYFTAPSGGTITTSRLIVEGGWFHEAGVPLGAWSIDLRLGSGEHLETVSGFGQTFAATFQTALNDQEGYILEGTFSSANGVPGSPSIPLTLYAEFPTPLTVDISADWDRLTGSVALSAAGPNGVASTYDWDGIAHQSTSTQTTDEGTLTNLFTNPSFEASSGTIEARRNYAPNPSAVTTWPISKGGNSVGTAQIDNSHRRGDEANAVRLFHNSLGIGSHTYISCFGLSPTPADSFAVGDKITSGVWVFSEGPTSIVFARRGSLGYATERVALTVGGWTYASVTEEILTTAQTVRWEVGWEGTDNTVPVGGSAVWLTKSVVTKNTGPLNDVWFSGDYSPDPDLTPSWTGDVNASASILSGTQAGTIAASNGRAWSLQSQMWTSNGTYSLRTIPFLQAGDDATRDTFASVRGDAGAMRLGMVAGKTYTVAVWCRLETPQTGVLYGRPRSVVFYYKTTGSYISIPSAPAPNEAGVHLVRHTFTVPADATEAFIRLYNGATLGNGDVWWDMFTIAEGEHPDLMPFDGYSQDTADVDYIEVQRRIDGGEWVTIATGLPVDAALTDYVPNINGVNEYRVVSHTLVPTTAEGEISVVEVHERAFVYLNHGPDMGTGLTLIGNPDVKDKIERNRAVYAMAGRKWPVMITGTSQSQEISFGGVILPTTSAREAFESLAVTDGAACYRDPAGRRVFGSVGSIELGGTTLEDVSGSLQRIDYREDANAWSGDTVTTE